MTTEILIKWYSYFLVDHIQDDYYMKQDIDVLCGRRLRGTHVSSLSGTGRDMHLRPSPLLLEVGEANPYSRTKTLEGSPSLIVDFFN